MDDSLSQTSFNKSSNYFPASPKKSRRVIFITFIIIFIGALFFGGKSFLGSKSEKQDKSTITPTLAIQELESPKSTPVPTDSPTPKPTVVPTRKQTVNPIDQTTGLDKSTLSLEVQNGSGEFGAASKASEVLKTFGYHVVAVGNADNFNYENVAIKVKSAKSDFIALLKKYLVFNYTIGTASADLSASSSADALVIVGK